AVGSSRCMNYFPPVPPFPPYPNPNDTVARPMSFPIAGYSLALPVDLAPGVANGCPNRTSATQAIQLTGSAVSRLFGGDIRFWDDLDLTAANPSLNGCHVPVTRVVRFESGAATDVMRFYLANVAPSRSGSLCDPGTTWSTLKR